MSVISREKELIKKMCLNVSEFLPVCTKTEAEVTISGFSVGSSAKNRFRIDMIAHTPAGRVFIEAKLSALPHEQVHSVAQILFYAHLNGLINPFEKVWCAVALVHPSPLVKSFIEASCPHVAIWDVSGLIKSNTMVCDV